MSAATDRVSFCYSAKLSKLRVFSRCLMGFSFSIYSTITTSAERIFTSKFSRRRPLLFQMNGMMSTLGGIA